MANCLNCKAKLSCGCQQRKASNGASVCANCLANYENNLRQTGKAPQIKPTIIAAKPQVWGTNRYTKK
jgi:hypothetical protein